MTTSNAIESTDTLLTARESCIIEINQHIDNLGNAYLAIGEALNFVRGDFENQAEFLDWVKAEFGIMKSQCFNLMKVAKIFGTDERFKGVSMRVLVALSTYVEDAAVMERAAAAAQAGELDTPSLKTIIEPAGKVPKATAQPRNMAANDPTPVDTEVVEADKELVSEISASTAPTQQPAQLETTERERGLLSLVETLKETIRQFQEEAQKRESERDTKVKAAPMLPQFKSTCMYARLGLSQEESQDAKKVKKAQRELVKLGYGAEHKAWPAISEAVEVLTQG